MKRSAVTLLAMATTVFTFSGYVFAEAPSNGMQLMAGNARLTQRLDTKSATAGEKITAKLTNTIKTPEGLTLPNGTELLGRVDQVKSSNDRSPAKLVLTFDQAELKDGKQVPIKATLVGISPAGSIPQLPEKVARDDSFLQEPGTLSGVSMHSAVKADSSVTLTSRDKNIDLRNGTQMLIAVAPASVNNPG